MVQIRIMHSDPDRVRQAADIMLPLLRACTALQVGDEVELPNRRDGGLRIVVEVTPAPGDRVRAERVVGEPERRAPCPPGALPAAGTARPGGTGDRE